jgi:hypothetical protein
VERPERGRGEREVERRKGRGDLGLTTIIVMQVREGSSRL